MNDRKRQSSRCSSRHIPIVLGFVVLFAQSILLQHNFVDTDGGVLDLSTLSGLGTTQKKSLKSLGRQIVERAFQESYAPLVEYCGNLNKTNTLDKCLRRTRVQKLQKDTTVSSKWPWWFQTLIRDASIPQTGLFGGWHYLRFQGKSPMQLCVYEKGGTKMWRAAHCQHLKKNGVNTTGISLTHCFQKQGQLIETDMERSVFLRDPLERFLSGFLDKCAYKTHRMTQPHCRPSAIFQNGNNSLALDFLEHTKKLFEIHVDMSPLKWDLHFLPLSFQCGGLYQTIKEYNFVGKMDDTFYQELVRFLKQYPQLQSEVREVFKLEGNEDSTSVGTEHKTATRTRQYFTPNTIRKVLQYFAADYVLLGLDIPSWAEDILVQDETFLV